METTRILEILYSALMLYRNGQIVFVAKDVIRINNGYENEKSTEEYYDEVLYYLYLRGFFGRDYQIEGDDKKFIGYTFKMKELNYLKP